MAAYYPTHTLIPFASNRRTGGGCGFDLFIYDRNTATVWTLPAVNTPADEFYPSLSQNNRWLVYSTNVSGDYQVRIYDLATELVNPLPTLNSQGRDHENPTINGDGTVIAYTAVENCRMGLYLFDLRTMTNYLPPVVARLCADIQSPTISTDGRFVAFAAAVAKKGPLAIYIYDIPRATLWLPPFLDAEASNNEPVLSPDNQRLVFSTEKCGHKEIRLLYLRTGYLDRLPLANSAANQFTPSFLGPKADEILFLSDRTGPCDQRLYIYELTKALLDTIPMSHVEIKRIDTISPP